MANTVTNVSTGKPATGGAIYIAPLSATLPTTADGTLTGFTCLGYVSEDGLTNSNSPSTESVKAWGGDTVLTTVSDKPDTFQFTLIEVLNKDVLKMVYGSDNVTGDLATGLTVKANNKVQEEFRIVVDMIMRNNTLKRIAIPDAAVSEIGDITYTDGDAVGYEITVNCMPDSTGQTHYEYLKTGSTT